MKTKPLLVLALISQVFFTTGCVTQRLWNQKSFYEPAPDPNLQIYRAAEGRDLLVMYDELQKNDATRRRAYFLYANQQRIAAVKKPAFVPPQTSARLNSVPLSNAGSIMTALEVQDSIYAVADAPNKFAIYAGSRQVSTHSLPVYRDPVEQGTQVALTPFALVADGVLIAGTLGIILAYMYRGSYTVSP